MKKIIIILPFLAIPKKNSQRIIYNKARGRTMIIQNERYLEFEKLCKPFMAQYSGLKINEPVNLKATIYVPDRRRRDLVNYLEGLQDVLVKHEVIADDNYNIIESVDGSRMIYEKGKQMTILEIEGRNHEENKSDARQSEVL